MARIADVHGGGKQGLGSNTLLKDWDPALADGLNQADGPKLAPATCTWPPTATCSDPRATI